MLPKIIKWAEDHNIDIKLFSTSKAGDGVRLAKLSRVNGFQRIVVLGGDGSVNEVARALYGSDSILGVLPGGSGNDFFKMLGNNGRLESALRTAFLGEPTLIDVGNVNGRPFFNSVGIGFDAEVARAAAEKKHLGGIWVYLLGVFKVMRKFEPLSLDIQLDQFKINLDATLVSIGNGQSSGGGFFLTPRAKFDDGLFDICVIEKLSKGKILRYLPTTFNGSHVRLPFVKMYRSRKIVIKSEKQFNIHIDGEVLPESLNTIEIKFESKKLNLSVAGKPE